MFREDDGSYTYARVPSAVVGKFPDVSQPGDEALMMHTPTTDDVGGDLTKIDTRQPPSSMHDVDYADVLGKKPVVLLFATPGALQQPRLRPGRRHHRGGQERAPRRCRLHRHGDLQRQRSQQGPRPQVQDFNLPSEPWLFVIDANGRSRPRSRARSARPSSRPRSTRPTPPPAPAPPVGPMAAPDAQRRGVRRPRLPAGLRPRLSSFCCPDSRALTALTRLSPGSRIRFAQPLCQCRCSVPPSRITVCAITWSSPISTSP